MGNCADKVLGKGWEATVGDYLSDIKDGFKDLKVWSLTKLKHFALECARKIDISQDESVSDVLQRLFARELGIGAIAQPTLFIALCQDFLNAFVVNVLRHPAVITTCREVIQSCIRQFTANSVLIQAGTDAFIAMLKRAEEALARQLSGTALREVAASTAVCAARSAEKAFLAAAAVNCVTFTFNAGYSQYQYKKGNITKKERNKHLTKRTAATSGSIAMTTICAGVGTLVCPGLGTFVGGAFGGMAGDYLGSKVGEAVYDRFSTP